MAPSDGRLLNVPVVVTQKGVPGFGISLGDTLRQRQIPGV
jgi:hypothetical protein